MEQLERKIVIRQITKSDDKDYAVALEIYNKMVSPSIKTDPNSITFWLNKEENKKFKLFVFALYLNDKIIGFAKIAYIYRTDIITLDYIELCEKYRTDNAIFSTYINLLQDFLEENKYNWKYIVNETSHKNKGKDIDEENRFFKKISFLEGFGKIEAKYRTPPLTLLPGVSSEAFLYIKSKNKEEKISKEDYLDIVKSIYYDYYHVWYEDFLTQKEFEHYKKDLDKSFNSIKLSRLSPKSFKVNYSPDALFISKSKIKTIALVGTIFLASPLLIGLCQYTFDFHETQNNLITLIGINIGSVEISGGIFVSFITTIVNNLTKKKSW